MLTRHAFSFAAGIVVGSVITYGLTQAFNQASSPVAVAPESKSVAKSKESLKRGDTFTGTLKSIYDGDTFRMENDGMVYNIRVWGIDAPELKQTCRQDSKIVACGKMAKAALEKILQQGPIICEHRGMHQQRIISTCMVGGQDISASLIRQGLALEDQDNTKGRYGSDESYAKDKKLGLWSMTFEQPAHWRACNMPIPKNLRRPANCS
jgi:endonuclease YncB( thermonuclease family)